MPEIMMPNNDFIKAAKEEALEKRGWLMDDELLDLVRNYKQEVIGNGCECLVVPGNKTQSRDTVAAVNYGHMAPLDAKEIFYSQRVLSTLFPKNFPHFYAAFGTNKNQDNNSGTIRQRIYQQNGNVLKKEIRQITDGVRNILNELKLLVSFDATPQNFVTGIDGGVYYLDTPLSLLRDDFTKDQIPKVADYMSQHGFSKTQINLVVASLERLFKLKEEKDRENYASFRV